MGREEREPIAAPHDQARSRRRRRHRRPWPALLFVTLTVSPVGAVFLEGRGNPRLECYVGVEVGERDPVTVTRHGTRVVQESCGDACNFHLRLCVNAPRAGCKPAPVKEILVIGDTGAGILSRPPLGDVEPRCAPRQDVVRVELGKRRRVVRHLTFLADVIGRPPHDKDTLTLVCQRSTRACCGDRTVDAGERCDDGNDSDSDGDGCDSNCTPTACGNGIRDASEQCDDGNLVDGDGCDSNCTPSRCGNGVADPREECDPPSDAACNGCGTYCDAACKCVQRRPCECPFTDGNPSDVRLLSFRVHEGMETCGNLSDGFALACNHLYVGGGSPNPIPDLQVKAAVTAVTTATCDGTQMSLSSAGGEHCTAPGCLFRPALQLDVPPLRTCILMSVAGPVSGTIDCSTWDVGLKLPLQVEIFRVAPGPGSAGRTPCPDCTGKTTRAECSTVGLNRLASMQLPDFALGTSLSPRSSFSSSVDQQPVFCGYCQRLGCFEGDPRRGCPTSGSGAAVPCSDDRSCTNPDYPICQQLAPGAFGHDAAREIREDGRPPNPLGDGAPHNATLVGIFCIPPTFNAFLEGVSSFPGPAAVGLTGDLQLAPAQRASTSP